MNTAGSLINKRRPPAIAITNKEKEKPIEVVKDLKIQPITEVSKATKEKFQALCFKKYCSPFRTENKYLSESYSYKAMNLEHEQGGEHFFIAVYADGYHKKLTPKDRNVLEDKTVKNETKLNILQKSEVNLVKYFTEKQLSKFEVTEEVKHISLVTHFDESNEQNIIVITLDRKMYIYPKERGDFFVNHSSFSQGKPVYFAGSMAKEKGKIVISNLSGHYAPPQHEINRLIRELTKRNISTEDVMLNYIGQILEGGVALQTHQIPIEEINKKIENLKVPPTILENKK